ncbi:MAG: dihydrolipoamide dehydrogenase [Maribacter sp.]|nr:MAG: dihydrolipoamide dehydrogenase [Maribacter sp.]
MKKISLIFGAFLALFIVACEGPAGPPGYDGLNGLDGRDGRDGLDGKPGIQGQVLQIDGVDFEYDPNTNLYSSLLTFEDYTDFEIFESDAVLVYRFDGVVGFEDGSDANTWSLIPQNFFLPEGIIQYTAAHTFIDLELFIDGDFNLANLDQDFTQNQFFRIVVVPSVLLDGSNVDRSDFGAIMNSLQISDKEIKEISID